MRYVVARFKEYSRDMAYRIFVSDGLVLINNNLAGFVGGQQIDTRYFDIINNAQKEKEENRTPQQIIQGLKEKMKKL